MTQLGGQRVAVRGFVNAGSCGVRDYSITLADRIDADGNEVSVALRQKTTGLFSMLRSSHELMGPVDQDVLIFQYASFGGSFRGVPLTSIFLPIVSRARGVGTITVAHEMWPGYGRRPKTWVLSAMHRLAMKVVAAGSHRVVVTTDRRAAELCAAGVSARKVRVIPVFSNWPRIDWTRPSAGHPTSVCVAGWGHPRIPYELIAKGLAGVVDEVILLGGAGASTPQGRSWAAALESNGVSYTFTGRLSATEASRTLAESTVALIPGSDGPAASKGTLAAALQNGVPVVAFSGLETWPDLAAAGAVCLVPENASALGAAITNLSSHSGEETLRLSLAGKAFYESRMSVDAAAEALQRLIGEVSLHQESAGFQRPRRKR